MFMTTTVADSTRHARAAVDSGFDPSVYVQVKDTGIVVTWVSADEEDGHVEWALTAGDLASSPNVASDDRGIFASRINKRSHRVTISGVTTGTSNTVHYRIVLGGVTSQDFSALLPSTALTSPADKIVARQITYPDTSAAAE